MISPRHDRSLALGVRTAAHYDEYPFEFLTPADERQIEMLQPAPFRDFVQRFVGPADKICEVGCGPGRGTMYLCGRSRSVTALDISRHSIELARARAGQAVFVQACARSLPFRDDSFDVIVSDGVLHHTGDAKGGVIECARVLRCGGHFYLAVYNRHGHYYYAYTYAGSAIRALERTGLGRLVVYLTIFPLYYLAHLVKSGGKRSWRGTRNFFYDYFMTPEASFHTRDEIEQWATETGLKLIGYDASAGNVHAFVLEKTSRRS